MTHPVNTPHIPSPERVTPLVFLGTRIPGHRRVNCGYCPECGYPGAHQVLPDRQWARHGGHWAECSNYRHIRLVTGRWQRAIPIEIPRAEP